MAVRRESVEIRVDSNLASVATRDAAAVALLRRELDSVNGHPFFQANSSGNLTNFGRNANAASQGISNVGRQANYVEPSINKLTGRLSLLADGLLVLGPGLIPIAAVGVQALGGLTAAATAAAVAGGSAVVAFQGVGDAIKAVQEYQSDKTFANLEKAREAMQALGPDAANFVVQFQKFRPVLGDIKDAAAAGWFPGLTASLEDFARLGPKIEDIFFKAGEAGGFLTEGAAESLSSERWAPFLDFLEAEVPTAMGSLMDIMGSLGHGAAEMFMAFDPGNDRFLDWLENVADGFDSWASSSAGRESINDFLEYARESGPEVAELFSSLVGALAAVVKAGAPIGQVVLPALSAVADMVKVIADSDIATPFIAGLAAMRLYSRAATIAAAAQSRFVTTAAVGGAGTSAAAATAASRAAALNAAGLTGTALGGALVAPRPGSTPTRAQRFNGAVGGFATVAGLAIATLAISKAASANNELVDSLGNVQGAIDSLDFTSMTSALDVADDSLASFKSKVESGKGFGSLKDPGALLANTKNEIEGIFGKSDIEEGDAARAKLEQQILTIQAGAAGLGEAMGRTIGPLDGSTRSVNELQAAMEAAKPAMDALGVSQADYVQVAQQQSVINGGGLTGAAVAAALGSTTPIDDLNDRLAAQAEKMDTAQGRSENYVAALGRLVRGEGTAAEQAKGLNEALSAMIDPTLDAEAALDGYRAALKSVKELDSKAGFTDKTEAGRTNRAETRAYTEAVKERLVTMVAAGRTEEQVGKALEKSREEFIRNGRAAGFSKDQMERRANAIGLTPKLVTTTFRAIGIGAFDRQVAGIRDLMKGVPKKVLTDIRANGVPQTQGEIEALLGKYKLTEKQRTAVLALIDRASGQIPAALAALERYDGKRADSYIYTHHIEEYSTRRNSARVAEGSAADGGTVPKTGKPYLDRHHYLLADGEEVISNRFGQADRYRGLLKKINANRRLAGGGTTGANPWGGGRGSDSGIDFDAIHTFSIIVGDAGRGLKAMRKSLQESTKELDKERSTRRSLVDGFKDNFTTDPFATDDSDIWASGSGSNPLSALTSDITDLKKYRGLLKGLEGMGLNGAALGEVDTLDEAQALSGMSRAEVRRYQRLYEQRAALASSVGGQYATAVTGVTPADIQDLADKVKRVERAIKDADKNNRDNRDHNTDKAKDDRRESAGRVARNRPRNP